MASNSSGETTAGPKRPTAMPAARLARCAASAADAPAAERQPHGGDHRVARAGDVGHLPRRRVEIALAGVGRQPHALIAARHQHDGALRARAEQTPGSSRLDVGCARGRGWRLPPRGGWGSPRWRRRRGRGAESSDRPGRVCSAGSRQRAPPSITPPCDAALEIVGYHDGRHRPAMLEHGRYHARLDVRLDRRVALVVHGGRPAGCALSRSALWWWSGARRRRRARAPARTRGTHRPVAPRRRPARWRRPVSCGRRGRPRCERRWRRPPPARSRDRRRPPARAPRARCGSPGPRESDRA